MKSNIKSIYYLLILWVAIGMVGCVVQPVVIETPTPPERLVPPETPRQPKPAAWHRMTSGAHAEPQGRVFYGIGKAENSRNSTLLRATAANHARKEMADVLNRYASELLQRVEAAMPQGIDNIEQSMGELVRNAVKQSVISDHWRDGSRARLFVLCRFELAKFKQMVATDRSLDESLRTAMLAAADDAHTALTQSQADR